MSDYNTKGILSLTAKGFGFVDALNSPSILIPSQHLGSALNGDEVEVETLVGSNPLKPSGRIVKVVTRNITHVTGTVKSVIPGTWELELDDRLPYTAFIKKSGLPLSVGLRVQCRIIQASGLALELEAIASLPALNSLSNILFNLAIKHPLPKDFTKDALNEVSKLADPSLSEDPTRTDLRHLDVFTIDPTSSRDFDDALSLRSLPNGNYEVGIHIADPSHYLKEGTKLDQEAYARATSIYFPGKVLPMLPERLSNELCSLQPDKDRYAVSLLVEMTPQAKILSTKPVLSLIRSKLRLTYDQAYAQLLEPVKPETKSLHTLMDLARKLRAARPSYQLAGELASPYLKLNASGIPEALEFHANDESHQLIEEFMLLANEHIALYLEAHNYPVVYRIHTAPEQQELDTWFSLLALHNIEAEPTLESIGTLRHAILSHPSQYSLVRAFMRVQSKAYYSPDKLGHFSLCKPSYAHFTSPIRRYADVLVHRTLKSCLKGEKAPNLAELTQKAVHISAQEIVANRLELDVLSYLYGLYYKDRLKDAAWKVQIINFSQEGAYVASPTVPISCFIPFPRNEEWQTSKDRLQARNENLTLTVGDIITFNPASVRLNRQRIEGTFTVDESTLTAQQAPAETVEV